MKIHSRVKSRGQQLVSLAGALLLAMFLSHPAQAASKLVNDEKVKAVYLGHTFDQPIALGVTPAEERAIFRSEQNDKTGPVTRAEEDELQRGEGE